ncbi:super-infection exclusion protein B [Shouchella lehensis]|uniref:Superinfection exclusion protein B n=1 Tax=Shouchella lehensis TaxID=300825 RepID=A0A4Y7WIG0_9BACI|nr:super-infection exclusion protein B [Shouchella lehensis]MBG9785614.1 hypothetical protein [Shouchella lehensis]TES48067.1 hypothetical protein E2L03_13105 [Shouchella lehensis]
MNFNVSIKDILTLPVNIMAALSLASGFLLLASDDLLNKFFLREFLIDYGYIIGLVFIVFISILIITLIINISKFIEAKRNQNKFYKNAPKRIRSLTNFQKAIVYGIYKEDNHTAPLPITDGAVVELEQKFVIGKTTNQIITDNLNDPKFPYLLQPWVVEVISNNTELEEDLRASAQKYF